MPTNWPKVPVPDFETAVHEIPGLPSVPPRNLRNAPRAAPIHNGHHLPTRHKRRAKDSVGPIHISYRRLFTTCQSQPKPKHLALYRISANAPLSFCVARNKVFFAVSSVVCKISPTVRSFNP